MFESSSYLLDSGRRCGAACDGVRHRPRYNGGGGSPPPEEIGHPEDARIEDTTRVSSIEISQGAVELHRHGRDARQRSARNGDERPVAVVAGQLGPARQVE